MKLKRKAMLCVTMFLMLTLLAGCGGTPQANTKESESPGTDTETESSPQDTQETEPVKLVFTYWGSPDEKAAIEGACEKFTQSNPSITVEPMQIPNADYSAKMTAMAAGNNAPDIGYMGDLGEAWANEGKFVNLFEMLEKDSELNKEDFLDYIWFKLSPDNAWGISTAAECYGLYYNKDIFDAEGIDPLPIKAENAMDWDGFVTLAKKLTLDKNGKNALDPAFDPDNIKRYGVMFETWDVPINNFIFANGGEWASADGKEFALNSPETADALQKLADLINVHHVAPSPLAAQSLPAMNIALESGLSAMIVGGQWINLDLGNAGVNFDIGVLPKLEKCITICTSGSTVIFESTEHPEEAWALMKYLANPAGSIEVYSGGLWMPIMKEWYTDPELVAQWVDANPAAHPAGFKDAMMNQLLTNGVPTTGYYLKNNTKLVPIVTSLWDQIWMGEKSAADTLEEIEAAALPEFKGRYDVE